MKRSFLGNGGLIGLNKALIDHSREGIKHVFDILSLDENFPVLIHCNAGKDRTGLIIALIQKLLDVTDKVLLFLIIRK